MTIEELLIKGRSIWGNKYLSLQEIVIRLGVGFGDLCRHARGADRDPTDMEDLKKELGNVIFSTIRWCDDLDLDPIECIESAIRAQERFAASHKKY